MDSSMGRSHAGEGVSHGAPCKVKLGNSLRWWELVIRGLQVWGRVFPCPRVRSTKKEEEEMDMETKMDMEIFGMNFGCLLQSICAQKFPDNDCLLPLLSKVLGYWMIVSSPALKLPQIWRVLKNRSVRGLSIVAFELELVGYTIGLAYCFNKGLPFSAYGEYAFLTFQCIILMAIIYYYSQPLGVLTTMKALFYCALAPVMIAGRVDPVLFEAIYASQHITFFFARAPQIWENFANQSTGELSFLTCFMTFIGCFVRIFTTIEEHGPGNMILGNVMGIVLNGIIVTQIFMYQKPRVKKAKKTRVKKEKKLN